MKYIITTIVILYGCIGPSYQQKSGKSGGGGGGGQGVKHSGNPGSSHGQGQYAASPYQHQGSYNQVGGAAAKPNYPLLLSDTRQLNNDGTINFQYAADNGLQQGETVDPDGTRRGFYSYPGADGKPITVKYTAGKNGFVAEGDHLPKQPNVPAHSEKDEVAYKPSGGQGEYYGHGSRPSYSGAHAGPVHRPQQYSRPQHQHINHSPQQYSHPAPSPPQHYGHGQAGPQHQFNQGARYPQFSPGQGHGGSSTFYGGGDDGEFGPVNYGAPSHSPAQQKHSHPAPPAPKPQQHYGGHGGAAPAGFHSALNPYQQAGPAGPYNGQFDLGNGGQFSINFNPGQPQEVPIGGDYGGPQQRY